MAISKYKVGDKVIYPFYITGVVTAIHDDDRMYPIEVTWQESLHKKKGDVSTFTKHGALFVCIKHQDKLVVVKREEL